MGRAKISHPGARDRIERDLLDATGITVDPRRPLYDLSSSLPFDAFQAGYRLYEFSEDEGADPIALVPPKVKCCPRCGRGRARLWPIEQPPTLGDVDDALAGA